MNAGIQSLNRFSQDLRRLPRTVAARATSLAAPRLTEVARRSFAQSLDPYGVPWAPGTDGDRVSLRKTGALERLLYYVGIGRKLRVSLGVPYARYQIGKRPIFPGQGAALPPDYVRTIQRAAVDAVRLELAGR